MTSDKFELQVNLENALEEKVGVVKARGWWSFLLAPVPLFCFAHLCFVPFTYFCIAMEFIPNDNWAWLVVRFLAMISVPFASFKVQQLHMKAMETLNWWAIGVGLFHLTLCILICWYRDSLTWLIYHGEWRTS